MASHAVGHALELASHIEMLAGVGPTTNELIGIERFENRSKLAGAVQNQSRAAGLNQRLRNVKTARTDWVGIAGGTFERFRREAADSAGAFPVYERTALAAEVWFDRRQRH